VSAAKGLELGAFSAPDTGAGASSQEGDPRTRFPTTNPFATRWVRPGALPYVWPRGDGGAALLALLGPGAPVEIIGPHGSGKSSLVAALVQLLRQRGRALVLSSLHDGGSRRRTEQWPGAAPRVHIVDGFEQLPAWRRRFERWRRWRAGDALLVTAHAPQGMQHQVRTDVDAALTATVVSALLQRAELPTRIDPRQAFARVQRHRGNLREALFELYDVYEVERRAHRAASLGVPLRELPR
jgi:hypothetical protein